MKTALAPKLPDHPTFSLALGLGDIMPQWHAFSPQTVVVTVGVPFQKDANTEEPARKEDNSDILQSRKTRQRVLDTLDEPPPAKE